MNIEKYLGQVVSLSLADANDYIIGKLISIKGDTVYFHRYIFDDQHLHLDARNIIEIIGG